jgi:hypothetical protein
MMRASSHTRESETSLLNHLDNDEDRIPRDLLVPRHRYYLRVLCFILALLLAVDLAIRPLPVFYRHTTTFTSNYETGFNTEPFGLTQQNLGVKERARVTQLGEESKAFTNFGDHSYDAWAGPPSANIDRYWEELRACANDNILPER